MTENKIHRREDLRPCTVNSLMQTILTNNDWDSIANDFLLTVQKMKAGKSLAPPLLSAPLMLFRFVV